jgi:acyl-CoA thioester hydrolase
VIHQIRVIYGDTDQMGIVYYGNYMRFFEASRAASLRALGRSNRDLNDWNIALPVIEAHCNYRQPAHYEDLIDIYVDITEVRRASLIFTYELVRDDVVLADGYTRHAVVDSKTGRPRSMPPEFKELLLTAKQVPRERRAD